LRYVSDGALPGISRRRAGPAFRYIAPGGHVVREPATLKRIGALAIPPAWEAVWICPRDDGRLQATGRDARGRKQYRYHARWREVRDETLRFGFRGKSGVEHAIELCDRRLAAVVRRMQDLPGEELFQYHDENGEIRAVESLDVNDYLREIAGDEFTSKDFRTWAGTVLTAGALQRIGGAGSTAEAKRNIARAIDELARQLGNTSAVCRKCYVHPTILECYFDGTLAEKRGVRSHRLDRRQRDRRQQLSNASMLHARAALGRPVHFQSQ